MTTYIRADHARVMGSRVDVVTLLDQMVRVGDSLLDFSQRWRGIKQGLRNRALGCFMLRANEKGEFFTLENKTSISRCE